MDDIESQEQNPLTNNNGKVSKKHCRCQESRQIKGCSCIIIHAIYMIAFLCILCSYIYDIISSYNSPDDSIDYYKENTIVKAGYWNDQERMCSVENPCYMNCIEYNRFDIQCEKENRQCILGRYDYCRDEPTYNIGGHGEEYRQIFNEMYPQ